MWDAFSLTEYSLMSVLSLNVSSMSKETLKELKFFFLQVTCFDPFPLPYRKDGTTFDETFPCILTPVTHGQNLLWLGPFIPRMSMLWTKGLTQKGSDLTILFLRMLWTFLSGVSSWELRSQTHLSLLSVCQKESFFFFSSIFKLLGVKGRCPLSLSVFLFLSFPDHLMLEDQLSCLSSHLP